MFGIHLDILQQMQDAGYKLANMFYLNGGNGLNTAWNTYMGSTMVAGTGIAALDVANVSDPTNLALIKSEVGGAVNRWMSMVNPVVIK